MKKLLFSAVSALAVVGVVQAANSTEFGVLTVPSSAAETIVAVPWLASGTGSESVKVADLVLTSGLNVGDQLLYYNGSGYNSWVLDSDRKWVAGNNVTESGVTVSAGADNQGIVRGKAIILKRGGTPAPQFYIMGKPTSDTADSVTLQGGGAYSLIAPPTVAAGGTAINSLTWTGMVSGEDRLIVPSADGDRTKDKTYRYATSAKTGVSGWKLSGKASLTTDVIPTGMGAWFYSVGTGEKSVSWGASANAN